MYQGDTKQVIITIYDEDGVILPLAGYDITWVVYHPTTKNVILSKSLGSGITVPTPLNGEVIIELLPVDTENVVPNTYNHECEISTSTTDVATTTTGTIKILYSRA